MCAARLATSPSPSIWPSYDADERVEPVDRRALALHRAKAGGLHVASATSRTVCPCGLATTCSSMNTSASGAFATTCCGLLAISHFGGKVDAESQRRMQERAAARDTLLGVVAEDHAVDPTFERVAIGDEIGPPGLELRHRRLQSPATRDSGSGCVESQLGRPCDRRRLHRAVRASRACPARPRDPSRRSLRTSRPS